MDYTPLADQSLADQLLSPEDMNAVLQSPDHDLLLLLQAAYKVRQHHFGRRVQLHVLMNAKSGLCPEDCAYCSQSAVSEAAIDKYPMLSKHQILEGARKARAGGAYRYCIVTSGRAPSHQEVETVADIVRDIKQEMEIDICCCLGLLDEPKAQILKAAGVNRINHNLNTSQNYSPEIVSTHTFEDRIETIKNVQKVGLDTCCGGIIGMGETHQDVIDLALSLRELDVDSIPINFLHPIEGTPLSGKKELTPQYCLKVLCLFRFLNPQKEIRVAGGREYNLRSLQPLALYPANSLFMEGYLTTDGQNVEETHQMIEDMGFEVETAAPEMLEIHT
ncbi:MAG: biotin synthase BioB [bacterium]|nr:biotin synthase BioB [bacterium]